MNNRLEQQSITPIRGYLEGYYGKLLSWSERNEVLNYLGSKHFSAYCYAPKEDPQHRLLWRESYNTHWRKSFKQFCSLAAEMDVSIIAGIAPGLDFRFDRTKSDNDFDCLLKKANELLDDGANDILILWDDIDANIDLDRNGLSEGTAHAHIINQLSHMLARPLWTVPRVYATEIEDNHNYLSDFLAELHPQHTTLLCGKAIVASAIHPDDLSIPGRSPFTSGPEGSAINNQLKHRTVVWDNFYANDYCPRRLFLGPWTGREQISDYLLNPTGLPFTDRLLLDIAVSTHAGMDTENQWELALKRHDVPDAFLAIAPYFTKPFFGDRAVLENDQDTDCMQPTTAVDNAIEECLWKWKSPLAREWYPFIFGLKHDLALLRGTLPKDRVLKTQPPALAKRLLD